MPRPLRTIDAAHAPHNDVDMRIEPSNEAGDALDALLLDHRKAKGDVIEEDDAAAKAAADAKAKEEADKAAADAGKTADTGAGSIDDAVKAQADEKAKASADKAAADTDAKAKADEAAKAGAPVKDEFDAVELPPHAKAKSGEAWAALKKLARESRDKLTAELAAEREALKLAKAEAEEAKKQVGQAPAEITEELEELRKFRAAHDIDSDPKWKEFDGKISKNVESIYGKLKTAGMSDASIQQIKDLGGPEAVDWRDIMPKLPLTTQAYIQATMVENVRLVDQRDEARANAKANAGQYLTERQTKEVEALTKTADGYLKNLPWTAEKKIPADAKPEERAALEAHNGFAKESMSKLQGLLKDRSPDMHAQLAVGTLMAYQLKREVTALEKQVADSKAAVETATKDLKAQLATVTAAKEKAEKELIAIKKAELPRGSADAIVTAAAKEGILDTRKAGESLDDLAKSYLASKNV